MNRLISVASPPMLQAVRQWVIGWPPSPLDRQAAISSPPRSREHIEMGQNMTALAKLVATMAILLVGLTDLASAERRVALVIGNSAYHNTTPLRNPRNDATALAAVLRKLDFEVLEGIDLDDNGFRRVARDFAVKIEDADVALFFYAGHGLQVNNRNYFMPVNAALKREADLDFEAV